MEVSRKELNDYASIRKRSETSWHLGVIAQQAGSRAPDALTLLFSRTHTDNGEREGVCVCVCVCVCVYVCMCVYVSSMYTYVCVCL